MKRYPEYKDSGVDWIGEIPNHWRYSRLKFHLAENSGGIWGQDDEFGNGTFVLRSTEITIDGSWDLQRLIKRQLGEEEAERFLLREDDLVITKSSGSQDHIGKTGLVDKKIESMFVCYSNFVQKLHPQSHINSKFLHYFMNCPLAREQYKYQSETTTGLANLSTKSIDELLISVPPTREQTQIAAFLDRKTGQIDELLRIKERRIELLQEQQTALINQAVTKGLDPSVEMKPSEVEWIGKIPRHWTMKRLKHVTESIKNGTTAPQIQSGQTDYPVTRIETISTGKINFDKVGHVNYWAGIENYRLRLGDILLSHINSLAILGNCAMFENSASLYHGMNLLRIRPNNLTDDRFLLYWLKSYATNQLIKSFAKFAIGQVSISITNLKEIPISYPLLSEQTQIANFLDRKTKQIDELISAEQRKIELLKEYRQSLISEAVTGKIDVRNEV